MSAPGLVAGAISIAVALMFSASAVGKLIDLRSFDAALEDTYGLGSARQRRILVLTVPAIEVLIVALAIDGSHRTLGLALSLGFLAAVLGFTTYARLQGATGDCGCFGPLLREPISRKTTLRAVAALSLSAVGLAMSISIDSVHRQMQFADVPATVLMVIGLGVLLAVSTMTVRTLRGFRELSKG